MGSSIAKNCPKGYYCQGGAIRFCDRHYQATGSHDDPVCEICPARKLCNFLISGAPQNCPQGSYRPAEEVECTPIPPHHVGGDTSLEPQTLDDRYTTSRGKQINCPGRFICPPGKTEPEPCPVGFYCNEREGKVECSAKLYCEEGGHIAAEQCPAYRYGEQTPGICETVEDGYFQIGDGNKQQCTGGWLCLDGDVGRCQPGQISTDALTCSACPLQKYCIALEASDCVAGFTCAEGSAVPQACEVGTYDQFGDFSCEVCLGGYYCPIEGMVELSNTFYCEAGYSCENNGSTSTTEMLCPPGKYCPLNGFYPSLCKLGTYNQYEGAISAAQCLSCPPGKYCFRGTATPLNCSEGHYCTGGSNLSYQNKAEPGHFAEEGSDRQLPCLHGHFQSQETQAACQSSGSG